MDNTLRRRNSQELLDYIYISVSTSSKLNPTQLFESNSTFFKARAIDIDDLKVIMDEMVVGKYLLRNDQDVYFPNPLKFDFVSFIYEFAEVKRERRMQTWYNTVLKILPIVSSILFGIIAVITSYSNLRLNQANSIVAERIGNLPPLGQIASDTNSIRLISKPNK